MAKSSKSWIKGDRSLLIIVGIIIACVVLFLVVFSALRSLWETDTYYVLNNSVPSNSQVTPEMLEPVTTPIGSAPEAAIGVEEVQTGNVYAQYPLNPGDILTMSNVGSLDDISVGVPDQWVITSFAVGADDAVQGRIQRGYYFDMMVLDENNQAYYPFVNVLALDTTVNLDGASSADAVNTDEAQDGQTEQYTVGMTPANAAKLQSIMNANASVKLVLSPRQNEYERPQLAEYEGMFSYSQSEDGVIWPGQPEGAEGSELTDRNFTDVKRDELGRPVESVETCSLGNSKVSCDDVENTE